VRLAVVLDARREEPVDEFVQALDGRRQKNGPRPGVPTRRSVAQGNFAKVTSPANLGTPEGTNDNSLLSE
jgi:hypothetical protein